MLELKKEHANKTLPLRLQAYERLTLLLERIELSNLVVRVYKNGMNLKLLHAQLINNIRQEYEHNLSQQLYVSSQSWEAVVKAREEATNFINMAASQLEKKGRTNGMDLSKLLLQTLSSMEVKPAQNALKTLKKL